MASFEEHINQAKNNLAFLSKVNETSQSQWDWQVTISFYSALHLINAHIAITAEHHYRSHEAVNNAISPFNQTSIVKLTEELYTSYMKLQNLSRRARYLCHEDPSNKAVNAHPIYDKHFAKSIYHLDKIISFVSAKYDIKFDKLPLSCIEFKNKKFSNFSIKAETILK